MFAGTFVHVVGQNPAFILTRGIPQQRAVTLQCRLSVVVIVTDVAAGVARHR